MKIKLSKISEGTINTSIERERIKKGFKNNSEAVYHLNKLMDYVEAFDWKSARRELDGEWWQGRDEELECPRFEFIGRLLVDGHGFDSWASYADLVISKTNYPERYKVEKIY